LFVALSKTLDLLLDPVAWAIALGLLAVALRRRPRAGAVLAIVVPLLLWAFSTEWTAEALASTAEEGARDTSRPGAAYDAVIVLGGAMDPEATEAKGRLELNAAADRYVAAFELLRVGRARTALLSAGSLSSRPEAPREAELAARMLARWGIEPERLVVEARSRNTRENAVECARIVRERGWRRLLLVTSAAHLPRALGSFRAVGLEPDALPVDFRAGGPGGISAARLLPRARALGDSAEVLRELAGRVVYRVLGYSR
jgi:uncharacterized SAM-binding protein YcdF (DUF218 family)